MKAFFAGSFDPLTTGHLNLIHRASMMFDEVVVAVMVNPLKKSSLTKEKRLEHLRKCTAHMGNVRIVEEEGLTVDAAKKHGCGVLVRGVRNGKDMDYEIELEWYNRRLNSKIETVYLSTVPELMHVSSTRVKEMASFHQSLKGLVPEIIREEVESLLKPSASS
ncbi:MAG: pantetheine-phosphate adenylyltransferase [Erysipelotrichaceae bacterium]|nr:pantetheine-phosphate adenylyltransferase [Erysipelotrichaceae bacterium]MBQ7890147.1 pantetheine-phosphate adenylyltransferase [Erysipelotrichaceae bacterium]